MSLVENRRIVSLLEELESKLDPKDKDLIVPLLQEYEDDPAGLIEFLQSLSNYDYARPPVDTETFLLHSDYLGLGGARGNLFPGLVDMLVEIFEGDYAEVILDGGIGWGKALALDTLVPAPHGWTTMGDLSVGDEVLDDQGGVCRVTRAYPVRTGRPCYEIWFSGGEVIVADEDHQWWASTEAGRAESAWTKADPNSVVTTGEMARDLHRGYAVPAAGPGRPSQKQVRLVTAIRPVPSVPVRCIEVDSPSHLFLVGKTYVPTHNSTAIECLNAKMLYDLSCLRRPQMFYGLNADDTIAVLNVSVNVTQAKKVVYGRLKEKVKASPYFREAFPFDPTVQSELRFPNNIVAMPTAASEGGTVGYTVYGAAMDEVNFWQVIESSKTNRGEKFDQAEHIYELLRRRIESRFVDRGGILAAVSSSKYPDSFTEKKRKEFSERVKLFELGQALKPKVYVKRNSQWGPKPRSRFMDEEFWLYIGGKPTEDAELTEEEKAGYSFRPFVTREADEIAPYLDKWPDRVIRVPMNYWDTFRDDLDGSIRDIAGYPTLTLKPWLSELDKLMEAVERGRARGMRHPLNMEETSLEDGGRLLRDRLRFDPDKTYFAHVDLAKGHRDKCGVAVGHVDHWKEVAKTVVDEETGDVRTVIQTQPYIVIDLMARFVAPKDKGDLKVDLVRGLLLTLREYGCNLRKVTFDQWNSLSSVQAFQRLGIESEEHSVDRTMDSYNAFKEALIEDRIDLYSYQPLIEEISSLEHNEAKDKVDHVPGGSKDVSDAVAAVCFHCASSEEENLILPSYGEFIEDRVFARPTRTDPAAGLNPEQAKKYTIDDLMWRGEPPGWDPDDDDDDYIGFA